MASATVHVDRPRPSRRGRSSPASRRRLGGRVADGRAGSAPVCSGTAPVPQPRLRLHRRRPAATAPGAVGTAASSSPTWPAVSRTLRALPLPLLVPLLTLDRSSASSTVPLSICRRGAFGEDGAGAHTGLVCQRGVGLLGALLCLERHRRLGAAEGVPPTPISGGTRADAAVQKKNSAQRSRCGARGHQPRMAAALPLSAVFAPRCPLATQLRPGLAAFEWSLVSVERAPCVIKR